MKQFDDNFLQFIRDNIPVEDILENIFNFQKDIQRSSINSQVYLTDKGKKIITFHKNGANAWFTLNGVKGDNIKLVQFLEDCDFVTAVKKLADFYNINPLNYNYSFINLNKKPTLQRAVERKEKIKKEIAEAEKNSKKAIENYKNLRINKHFTNDIRGISKALLNYLRDNNKLKFYRTDKYATIKIPLYCNIDDICGIQDIYKKNNSWRKINHGKAGIYYTGNLDKINALVLTESFFDSLSALQIKFFKTIKHNPYYDLNTLNSDLATISINGSLNNLKKEAILDVIKNSPMLKTIIFAFDDDNMGQKYISEIKNLLESKGFINKYSMKLVKYKGYKDFNEYLQAMYNQNLIHSSKFKKEKKVAEITR
jgi:hypothetical protein